MKPINKHLLIVSIATAVIATVALLFGDKLVLRVWDSLPANSADTKSEWEPPKPKAHSIYSAERQPFIHPRIIGDLIPWISETYGSQHIVAVNLTDSQDSNRYHGEIFDISAANQNGRWVYWVEEDGDTPWREGGSVARPWENRERGVQWTAYRFVGTTPSGLDILHARRSTGGSAIYNHIAFTRILEDAGADL
ncbi:MAG: hypothetical protein F4171_15670 [Gammaproteobacteria bacterium]|nr:hypothetical protein [Gammaproteobacteria bacterium]MYG14210.1 hypothetical protein [Gammaproteobacteria bacterium]MYK27230.1 hypothetical protein [Gammaproteobacteria bacterium]